MHVSPVINAKTLSVDNTDWLKTMAILLAAIDHFAIYFVETEPLLEWLEVAGRLSAPLFFFLIGFSTSRVVPIYWLVLGFVLMFFEAWGDNWDWGAGSILFSFAAFRFARPFILGIIRQSWLAFVVIVAVITAAGAIFEIAQYVGTLALYGASGWLWALLGACHREYIDAQPAEKRRFDVFRWLVLPITICVFLLQISRSYTEFSSSQQVLLAVGLCVMAVLLMKFRRGVSAWQPGGVVASVLRFCGHNTLEIYAAQLIASPVILKIWPQLVF